MIWAMDKLSSHGAKQVDLLRSGEDRDLEIFFRYWAAYVFEVRTKNVFALDWTSFKPGDHEVIMLSMLAGHGRATPRIRKR